ncbi:MAG: hypothetical protein GVY06_06925, partial [Alphaproteobacteria bacterium]|nr:hypothetical protein [Alphaproteobacteria bacterium]
DPFLSAFFITLFALAAFQFAARADEAPPAPAAEDAPAPYVETFAGDAPQYLTDPDCGDFCRREVGLGHKLINWIPNFGER